MSDLRYEIIELCESFHGELPFMGKPCVIVRFQRCNLLCAYCDADMTKEPTYYSLEELVEAIDSFGLEEVLITGGEPLLYPDHINQLLQELIFNHHVTIETNGTLDVGIIQVASTIVMDVKLFKSWMELQATMEYCEKLDPHSKDAIKFVYSTKEEFEAAEKFIDLAPIPKGLMIIFSPIHKNLVLGDEILQLQKKHPNYDIRVQTQIHKILNFA